MISRVGDGREKIDIENRWSAPPRQIHRFVLHRLNHQLDGLIPLCARRIHVHIRRENRTSATSVTRVPGPWYARIPSSSHLTEMLALICLFVPLPYARKPQYP